MASSSLMEQLVQVPVQITFRDMPVCDVVEALCWSEVEKLRRHHRYISSCRVVIWDCRRRLENDDVFVVHIDLTLSNADLLIPPGPDDRRLGDDLQDAVRLAFLRARRHLLEHLHDERSIAS